MFDHRTLASLAACVIAAAPLGAQTRPSQDSLLRRVLARDSLLAIQVRVVDSVRRSVARPVPSVDVIGGPLHVRTQPELKARVAKAVDSVAGAVERRGGTAIARRLAARVPSISRDSTPAAFGVTRTIVLAPDTVRRWSVTRHRLGDDASVAELTTALTRVVEEIAFEGVDSTLSAWVMMGRVPLGPATADELSDAYIALATTESAALRRCRSGDDPACVDALGIDSVAGGRLSRWYAPTDYRSLLRSVAPPREDSASIAAWLRCRERREEAACRIAATALPEDRVPLPLNSSARLLVLREVLDAGGPGAFDRLVTTSGTLKTRFEAASGEPIERTIRRWLGRVERSRPERTRVSPQLALASLGWSGVLLALTLTRRHSWV
jgi:hypothetical protein